MREFFESRINKLRQSLFFRRVGILLGGTALAQLLTIASLPILTRLYSPADFEFLAVFVSLLGVLSVVASMRLEVAIPIAETDEEGMNLLAAALIFCLLISGGIAICVWLLGDRFTSLIRQPQLSPFLWMLPIGVFLSATNTVAIYWATRKQHFRTIAKARVSQVFVGVSVQILLGVTSSFSSFGLLFGQMISSGGGGIGVIKAIWSQDRQAVKSIRFAKMGASVKKFSDLPKFGAAESLINTAAAQLPMIIIAAMAVGPEAGYLMLAIRVAMLPMGLLGGAIGQVYLSEASRADKSTGLSNLTLGVIEKLIKIGVGPIVFLGVISPALFPIVFGREWARAGTIVLWLVPWFCFQFVASPISMIMHITHQQRKMLKLASVGFLLRLSLLLIAASYTRELFSEMYAISGALFYFICLIVFARAASVSGREMKNLAKSASLHVILGGGSGAVFFFVLHSWSGQ